MTKTKYKVTSVLRITAEPYNNFASEMRWSAYITWTTGFLWWKKYHSAVILSETGIMWRGHNGGLVVYPFETSPNLEAIVDSLEERNKDFWSCLQEPTTF